MKPEELKNRLETISEDAQATVNDLTGTQDHYHVVVVSSVFKGKTPIEKHRMVMGLVSQELQSGEIHAFTLEAKVSD